MTWTDESTSSTAWREDTSVGQVIDFIDNTYNINYNVATINGKNTSVWENETELETAWRNEI